jgi:hypothetical protein
MAVIMKNCVFWGVVPCDARSVLQLLVIANVVSSTDSFHSDDGGDSFLRNVGSYKI